MQRIDGPILDTPVIGLNLRPGTLGDQLESPATLVAFLRHLGCLFCREMVGDLRAAAADAAFPPVLLVTQSPAATLEEFFVDRWPAARAIADPDLRLYQAMRVGRASFNGMVGPAVWSCGFRAHAKGHRQALRHTFRPASGDPWLLSALFLVEPGGAVRWECRAKHAGDRPDYAAIPLRTLAADAPGLPSPGMAGRG